MSDRCFICFATSGRCSEISIPGALVFVAAKGPPVSVPGLGSHVSSWLGAPIIHRRMQRFALAILVTVSWPHRGRPNLAAMAAPADMPTDSRKNPRLEHEHWCMVALPNYPRAVRAVIAVSILDLTAVTAFTAPSE